MNRLPRRLLGVVLALQSSMAWSQNTLQGQPSNFEAAVITPSDPSSADVWLVPETGGGLRAQNVVAWQLIKNAYYIRDEQLEGGPGGLKLRPAGSEGGPVARMRNGQLPVTTDAKGIAALLTDVIGTTVVDETGLTGYYTINLEWAPDAAG